MPLTKTLHKDISNLSSTKALAESFEEKFNLLLETVEDFVFILDANGCFENASYKGAISLGYLPNELRKKHITEIVVDRNKSILINSIRQILTSQKQISLNLFFSSKTLEEIKHGVTIHPLKTETKITGLIGTDLIQLE